MRDDRFVAARPEDVGVDSGKLEALFARAERDVKEGKLPSAQVALARKGRLAGVRTFGAAVQGGVERPATNQTLYCLFSATKAIVGVGVWALFDDGLLRLEERVADIIPEFATNGKDGITVEQVLTHTSGYPFAPFRPDLWDNREELLKAFSRWRLNWEPGTRFEYHATSAHWTLTEIICRRTGCDYRQYVRDRVLTPMGLDELFLGMPAQYHARTADVVYVEPPVEPPGGWGEVTPLAILRFNEARIREAGNPGGGGYGGAADLAMFYQPLVNGGLTTDGRRLLKQETIDFATTVRTTDKHREPLLGIPINRALAVMVAGGDGNAHLRGFGHNTSPRAFGHAGAGGQIAWGDPASGISLGYCTQGFADPLEIGRRTSALSGLAAVCAL